MSIKQNEVGSHSARDIVIEIDRGMVSSVATDIPDARVVVIDWDNVHYDEGRGVTSLEVPCLLDKLPVKARKQYHRAIGTKE